MHLHYITAFAFCEQSWVNVEHICDLSKQGLLEFRVPRIDVDSSFQHNPSNQPNEPEVCNWRCVQNIYHRMFSS